ncbi:MAG: UDP-glucose 4-epimerase, partial [Acidimicrobiales bacterium]
VDAFVRAADRGSGLLCNVGTGVETSVNDLYSAMATAAGHSAAPVYAPPRPGELARSALDPGQAGVHLGWSPRTRLEEGTDLALRWFASRARAG